MAQATGNKAALRFSAESTWGETPSGPAMTEIRFTSESLRHRKQTITSQEVRSDRMRADILEVGQSSDGDIAFELSYGDWEAFFEGAFASTITSSLVTDASVTVSASTITGPTGTNFTVFKAGQYIRLSGASAAANADVVAKISSLTSTVLTITGTTLTSEVTSATVNGRMLRNGTTEKSYLIEENFSDITAVKYFTGMEPSQMQINVQAQQIVTGVFSFVGKGGATASVTIASSVASATNNVPMTAAVNVGNIFENNVALATNLTGLQVTMNGNLRQQPAVGSKPAIGIGQGGYDVTGTLTAYFEDISLYQKMINHTVTSLSVRFEDTDGNIMVLTIPSDYYSEGDPVVTGIDTDVFLPLTFAARRDSTTDTMLQLDFLPATP